MKSARLNVAHLRRHTERRICDLPPVTEPDWQQSASGQKASVDEQQQTVDDDRRTREKHQVVSLFMRRRPDTILQTKRTHHTTEFLSKRR